MTLIWNHLKKYWMSENAGYRKIVDIGICSSIDFHHLQNLWLQKYWIGHLFCARISSYLNNMKESLRYNWDDDNRVGKNFQARRKRGSEKGDEKILIKKDFSRNAQTVSSSVTYWACNITFADDAMTVPPATEKETRPGIIWWCNRASLSQRRSLEKVIILWARSAW